MSKILFDTSPLVVDTILATQIGLNEAIVLQQVHYWIEVNKAKKTNYYDGYYWTYNSMKEWSKRFPFFAEKTLKRIFNNLEEMGIFKTGNYNKMRMDRTKWYTIDYIKLEEYIDKHTVNEEVVEEEEEVTHEECSPTENTPRQIDPMQYPKRENALGQNDPMQEDKLTQCKGTKWPNALGQNDPTNTRDFTETSSEISSETSSSSMKDIVEFFQNNFYLLQAYEAEVLTDWVNRLSHELVLAAMKESRKNNAKTLKYIERTLLNWERDGIKTLQQVEAYNKAREAYKNGQGRRDNKAPDESNEYKGLGLKMSDLQ
ncbi:DnaD domain-containing protein [Cellulosilyticum sp. WCF-2]|uniref:DnaD domain-containing protein n=1 Tax=Cellulosilyticum sp. WCF-2 TaxID=2497860 RepID=UPI000F8EBEDC|nr:DnaD domain protein [Cellulosilyticum sp. WCF-2]QEH67296.1 DnaD domain protein [Cellulosilyticum sp. WCF-2]